MKQLEEDAFFEIDSEDEIGEFKSQVNSPSETLDLEEVLNEVLAEYKVLIKAKSIKLCVELEGENIYIAKSALKKVLSNLISNAVKYTEESGSIHIYTDQNKLYIENTGKVLSEKELKKVFEIFYRSEIKDKNSLQDGNGLGLYVVKNILDLYGFGYDFKASAAGMVFVIDLMSNI